ncbi:MAG TPA: hypothetical protein VJP40_02785 [bacterium]|nr:hypothetical protein [bacterium]
MACALGSILPSGDATASDAGYPLPALGAFSCDFTVDLAVSGNPAPTVERDRIWLQQGALELKPSWAPDPGMLQKHIPIIQAGETTVFAGGRYLFTSRLQAARYEDLILNDYTYPEGVNFLSRTEFSDSECRDWGVVIAWRFTELNTHTAMRTERFDTGRTTLLQEATLRLALLLKAPEILAEAKARGLGEVHILHNAEDHKVQIVYFQPRLIPDNPDGAALGKLLSEAPFGDFLQGLNLTPVFDRTAFVFNVWLPYEEGDTGEAALWPNSPPLPGPYCGDGVCVPSHGENGANCAADCAPGCGNGSCEEPEESKDDCPVDCSWEL